MREDIGWGFGLAVPGARTGTPYSDLDMPDGTDNCGSGPILQFYRKGTETQRD